MIFTHAEGATSFLTLYDGFQYFQKTILGQDFLIAYMDTSTTWVGASEPIGPKESLKEFLLAFSDAARAKNKRAILLPVSKKTADLARELGFYALEIGKNPWFNIQQPATIPSSANQLRTRGAKVEAFDPSQISTQERIELDLITQDWLDSRKMAPIAFLNRLEPWSLMAHKSYFRVLFHGQQLGYLAAVPIGKTNRWYFADLVRHPDSPAGTTELLVTEAMTYLGQNGSPWITLGMSPLVPVESGEQKYHPFTYSVLRTVFDKFNLFYGFKSLYEYKSKFEPQYYEAQYLISFSRSIGLREYWGLFNAIFPKGLFHTLAETLIRSFKNMRFSTLYQNLLDTHFVPRSPPRDLFTYIYRCKATLSLAAINLLYFFTSIDPNFLLRPTMVSRYGYSLDSFLHKSFPFQAVIDLIIASFLHWNVVHLVGNLMMLLFAVSFLECIAGSSFVLLAYLLGVIFSNPLTSLFLFPLFDRLLHSYFLQFWSEYDVGTSLGIFSCVGALIYFSRFSKYTMALCCVGTMIYAYVMHSWLGLNHITALLLGYGLGKLYAAKK